MSTAKPTGGIGSRVDDPTYLDFYRRCAEAYVFAEQDYAFRRYPDAYYHTYDVLEFFWKALSVLSKGNYDRWHLPPESVFDSLMSVFSAHIDGQTAASLKQLFLRYNRSWSVKNPEGRANARYGKGIKTPYNLIGEQNGKSATQDSKLVATTLARLNRELRIASGLLHVGLLDGRFSPSNPSEQICNIFPWADFSADPLGDWANRLSSVIGVKLTKIAVVEISPKFQIVVNPFGEAFPDLPTSKNVLPGYIQIREFISNGGVFVTAGGHPFTYYFDVTTGKRGDVFKAVQNVIRGPPSLNVIQNRSVLSIPTTNVVSDTLLGIDFDCETTWDTRGAGATPMVPRRDPQDRKLSSFALPGQLNEFRAIDPKTNTAVKPVIRGTRSDGLQVFPAALIPRHLGLLYHVGLDLSQGRTTEFKFASDAVEALCRNFSSYFDP